MPHKGCQTNGSKNETNDDRDTTQGNIAVPAAAAGIPYVQVSENIKWTKDISTAHG